MAFKFFKKEDNFPADEKAEILEGGEQFSDLPDFPELPEFPEMDSGSDFNQAPNFGQSFEQGFRAPEELKPRIQPREEFRTPMQAEPPRFPAPIQRQMPVETRMPMFESEFGQVPKFKGTPHIYIRIDKYKEVMNAIMNLREQIRNTKSDLDEIHSLGENEREKIKDSARVLLEIEKILSYLNTTFTTPED